MKFGWIKLNRKIFENFLWRNKEPFDKRSAWIDLLLLANHKDHEIVQNGKPKIVKRGEVNRSLLQLAARWNWSRGKVRRFIDVLEANEMCTRNSTTDGTTLTIVNYGNYQDYEPTNSTTDGTTDGQLTVQRADIYKNDYKNVKEQTNKKIMTNADKVGLSLRDFVRFKAAAEREGITLDEYLTRRNK